MRAIRTHSADDTVALGERLGERLVAGDVVVLTGDLGSGKTTFVRGVAAGLGADPSEVRSPSFTLVNSYAGRLPLYHLDLYRLEGEEALESIGWEEYLSRDTRVAPPDGPGVTVIEWGERARAFLPVDDVMTLVFAAVDGSDHERLIAHDSSCGDAACGKRLREVWRIFADNSHEERLSA